ncbi:MAG: glycosyltransferase [Candidatus Doudnabacteria bacterium]|nr:glycosyltransferase [Candidatus Doudnabacteria bacterium]
MMNFFRNKKSTAADGFQAANLRLPLHKTAKTTLDSNQKIWILVFAAVFGLSVSFNWRLTLLSVIALLMILYFIDLIFNLFLIFRSFSYRPEIVSDSTELNNLDDAALPVYTVFCPLYRESAVLPQFIRAMGSLDYPKDKLQILLLLEEDDRPTIRAARAASLPPYFEIAVVPHSLPKTKPKAMNHGLGLAKGEYITIYDAEDVPDPRQLKKAYLAFHTLGPKVVCVQSKLNFYNPSQNFVTRLFTAEYSLWFDLVLPGLQSLGAPIPLGGTSNHFRTADLIRLKGWDPFNVTEDCDLGVRLAKHGYRTAIIDSTTYEEANSHLKNWYSQRSRWIKGYMQTYLVHMRSPKEMWKDWREPHLLTFQLVVGGKILSMFINPLLWLVTIIYFLFRSSAAPYIEPFFPGWILYLGVFSLVFGNFLYLYYYMIGLAKRQYDGMIKYAFAVPFYWLAMSLAAWQAFYEIIFKPHYWAKTVHGLHLDKKAFERERSPEPAAEIAGGPDIITVAPANVQTPSVAAGIAQNFAVSAVSQASFSLLDRSRTIFRTPKKFLRASFLVSKNKVMPLLSTGLGAGTVLAAAMMTANFFNFFYNAYLGRVLSYETFGIVILFNTFLSFLTVFVGALSTTVTHRAAYLKSRFGGSAAEEFMELMRRKSLWAALAACGIWLVSVPMLESYFNLPHFLPFILFAPVIALSVVAYNERAFLQGGLFFKLVGAAILAESGAKLFSAFLLAGVFHLPDWVYLSIPISLGASALCAWLLVKRVSVKNLAAGRNFVREKEVAGEGFPAKFFLASLLAGLSTSVFLNFDVFLTKHYFPAALAGEYSLLSLIGKMIYFLGSLLISFIVALVSSNEGQNASSQKTFYRIFAATAALVFASVIALGPLGGIVVPLLFGAKAVPILPFLTDYMLAMALFTLSTAILMYHLARRQYVFSGAALLCAAVMCAGIILRHGGILQVTHVMLLAGALSLAVLGIMHALERQYKFIRSNFLDFLGIFSPNFPAVPMGSLGKRVLIFNWRDTRHAFAGGAEVYVHELARRWADSGTRVVLFCGNDGNCPREEIIDGVHIVRRGGFYFVYVWAFFYYLFRFRGKFNVIVDCQNGIPFFTPLYAREKIYCLMHHVHQEVFRKHLRFPLSTIASLLENTAMPLVYKKVKFITISDSSKSEMENLGLGSAGMEIVHPGVDLQNLEPGEKYKQPLVLYLGRLKAYKSVDVLINAFRHIAQRLPAARLVIAGDGEDREHLEKLTQLLRLGERVSFLGKISEQEKISWLKKAWVFCNPSMMEGWGITTIEANACGVPVVAANVPGLRDSVNNPHTGFLVEHGNAPKFAEHILKILTNRSLQQFMEAQSVKWAAHFDWDASAKKSLKIIYGY